MRIPQHTAPAFIICCRAVEGCEGIGMICILEGAFLVSIEVFLVTQTKNWDNWMKKAEGMEKSEHIMETIGKYNGQYLETSWTC